MEEKEQIIEATGWHVWADGYYVQKVDRCILLGEDWHYHVIEDNEGKSTDNWEADYERDSTDPLVLLSKDLAIEQAEREEEQAKLREDAKRLEEESEDTPLIERISKFPISRVRRIVEKATGSFTVEWKDDVRGRKEMEHLAKMLEEGGISQLSNDSASFIPFGSIDRLMFSKGATVVTTKGGLSYKFGGDGDYDLIRRALSIYSK